LNPEAPGPFAFANPDRVRDILERAGFKQIEITARDELVGSGEAIGASSQLSTAAPLSRN
jgi:hypothetical protein